MSAINYFSFKGDGAAIGPHRPSLDNLGGDRKLNDTAHPPDQDGPSAEEWNERTRLVHMMAGICPVIAVTIEFDAGTPYVTKFWAANDTLMAESLTLTDGGAGDTTIEWPAGTLPASALDPMLTINDADLDRGKALLDEALRSVQVLTFDAAGDPTDGRFTLMIY